MFAGSFFSIFMYAEKAVVWTQRKEESMNVRFIGSVIALIWCFHTFRRLSGVDFFFGTLSVSSRAGIFIHLSNGNDIHWMLTMLFGV